MEDLKNLDIKEEKTLNDIKKIASKAWDTFHKFGLWITIFLLIGCWVGVSVAKTYYTSKMDEIVTVGAFLHKSQVYQIIKK